MVGAAAAMSSCSRLGVGAKLDPPLLVPLGSPDRVLAAGRPQRIPLGLVTTATSVSIADDQPVLLRVLNKGVEIDRAEMVGHIINHDHVEGSGADHQHSDVQRYYPLRTTLPDPGIYDLELVVDGQTASVPIQAFDPSDITVPLAGDRFPALTTPTFAKPDGVDQLCTRFEPCPLHEHDAATLLETGRPFALLIATPAFCQTAYCGPVVDTLVEAVASLPDDSPVEAVHVEVYANPNEVGGDFNDPAIRLAPAVEALGLLFEPSLFLITADGVILDRLDNVFDLVEVNEALAALT